MSWDTADFTIFGILLATVVGVMTLAMRTSRNAAYRFAAGIALFAAFLLVWINGAVGIIGDEGNDANMMYFSVLAIGIAGAFLARFQSAGMARALFVTALAQIAVASVALIARIGSSAAAWPGDVLLITAFFTVLWLGSALLFRKASTASS